jgi:Fe-S-cluster-containing hydrogenase component 2
MDSTTIKGGLVKMAEEQSKSKGISRREVVVGGGAALAGVIAGVVAGKLSPGPTGPAGPQGPTGPAGATGPAGKAAAGLGSILESKGYIVYDPELCVGCRACEMICSATKNGAGHVQPSISRIRVVRDFSAPNGHSFWPLFCYQCKDPKCRAACVPGAISADSKTGARVIDEAKCIGCGICVVACAEYHGTARIYMDSVKKKAFKCDLCGGEPKCVKWCANAALTYVGLDDLRAKGYEQNFWRPYKKDFGPDLDYLEGGNLTFKNCYPELAGKE